MLRNAIFHATLEIQAYPVRPDSQRIHFDAQTRGNLFSQANLCASFFTVIIEHQLARLHGTIIATAVKTELAKILPPTRMLRYFSRLLDFIFRFTQLFLLLPGLHADE